GPAPRRLRDRGALRVGQAARKTGWSLDAARQPGAADSRRRRQGADVRAAQPRRIARAGDRRKPMVGAVDGAVAGLGADSVQRRRERLEQRRLAARRLHLPESRAISAGAALIARSYDTA